MFEFIKTDLSGLYVISNKVHIDDRGWLIKKFHKSTFKSNGFVSDFSEELISCSHYGVLRGLHFQTKNPQAKLVTVLRGKIYDVVVDLRLESSTYGKHYSIELSDQNKLTLLIPEGFAHGFLSLEEETIVSYLCSTEYESDYDGGIIYNDPDLKIIWPKIEGDYLISSKDNSLGKFRNFLGFNHESRKL
jgi:dTDP-4-dehydrorhamnose 3,5-epimerase